MESLEELNKICQKPRHKEVGNWMVRRILRYAALPMTWLLLHTRITANQVTLAAFIVGLGGLVCLVFPGIQFFWAGILLLQLWYYLDHVDGQIARYRGTASLTGRFLDFTMHHVIHGAVLFSLGYFVCLRYDLPIFAAWGFVASLAMMILNMIYDIQYKTFFWKLSDSEEYVIRERAEKAVAENPSAGRRVFSWLHKVCEMHVIMNLLTLGVALKFFIFHDITVRPVLFIFYGTTVPFLTISKLTYYVANRKADCEFKAHFEEKKAV